MIKICIVGAGNMAIEHIKAFTSLKDVSVVGITSRTLSKASTIASKYNIDVVADDINMLYEKTQADAVVITVPELALNDVAKKCFSFPWSVLMEKPAGYCLSDAESILHAANDCQGGVFVAFNRRFYNSAIHTQQILAQSGGQRHVVVNDQQSFAEARACKHPEEVVEHFMYANSVHLIDYFSQFARGELDEIVHLQPWQGEATEQVIVHMRFSSGDTGLYNALWNKPGPWSCIINTMENRIQLQPLEQLMLQPRGKRKNELVNFNDEDDQLFKPGLLKQAKDFIKYLNGQKSDCVSIHESMRTMRLIHKIYGV